MTTKDLRQLHKEETGDYPANIRKGYGDDEVIQNADRTGLLEYIEWLENKIVEFNNNNNGS